MYLHHFPGISIEIHSTLFTQPYFIHNWSLNLNKSTIYLLTLYFCAREKVWWNISRPGRQFVPTQWVLVLLVLPTYLLTLLPQLLQCLCERIGLMKYVSPGEAICLLVWYIRSCLSDTHMFLSRERTHKNKHKHKH